MAVPTGFVPPRKKSTLVTVAPALGAAMAVRGVAALSATIAPFKGAESDIAAVPVAIVTLTAVEVIAAPFESVTRAVSEKGPDVLGIQFTE